MKLPKLVKSRPKIVKSNANIAEEKRGLKGKEPNGSKKSPNLFTRHFLISFRTTISNNLGYGFAVWLNETTVNYPVRQETLLSYSNFSLNYDIGALVRR